MIIGQFCETYPPILDGVGRVMLAYCQTLQEMGHRCIYVAPCDVACTQIPDLETQLYPGVGVPGNPYRVGVPSLSRDFRRVARTVPFDVVHVHSPFLAGRAARRIARRRGIPLVATFHSKYYDDFYRTTHSKSLARLGVRYVVSFYRTCDEIWAVNEKTAAVLHEYGFKGEIVIMPNGTNPQSIAQEDYDAAMSQFPLRDHVPTLLFVGQMDYKKNVHSILRACALLHERGVDFQLIMAGDGQDARRARDLCHELALDDRVFFTGFIGERTVTLSLFRRADLFVFPSVYDNAPMVVREAATMGTPSLLVEHTCSAEGITHNENGFLCQNTAESIADGIVDALPLCKAVGERARQTIPIPWNQLMKIVLNRYESLIESKSERSRA